jgi:CheY-like chemotaxis protein
MTTPHSFRVLVIDDDEIAREFLCEILRRGGFGVEDSPSTIGVTNRLVREGFHAVVLDVHMPAISGDKLTALLRKNEQLAQLGVVLVSSAPREELDEIARAVDASAVISKEEARGALVPAVLRACQRAASAAALATNNPRRPRR